MDKQALKPCPFCGGIAILESDIKYYKYYEAYFKREKVKCSVCRAETKLCIEIENTKAIDLWNRRVNNG